MADGKQSELLKVLAEIRDELRLRREQEREMYTESIARADERHEEWRETRNKMGDVRFLKLLMILLLMVLSFIIVVCL